MSGSFSSQQFKLIPASAASAVTAFLLLAQLVQPAYASRWQQYVQQGLNYAQQAASTARTRRQQQQPAEPQPAQQPASEENVHGEVRQPQAPAVSPSPSQSPKEPVSRPEGSGPPVPFNNPSYSRGQGLYPNGVPAYQQRHAYSHAPVGIPQIEQPVPHQISPMAAVRVIPSYQKTRAHHVVSLQRNSKAEQQTSQKDPEPLPIITPNDLKPDASPPGPNPQKNQSPGETAQNQPEMDWCRHMLERVTKEFSQPKS